MSRPFLLDSFPAPRPARRAAAAVSFDQESLMLRALSELRAPDAGLVSWAGRYCDHILMLYDEGRVLAGSAAELMTLKNLEELYQCGLREIETEVGSYFLPA